jgi:hypothetical protein
LGSPVINDYDDGFFGFDGHISLAGLVLLLTMLVDGEVYFFYCSDVERDKLGRCFH